MRKNYKCSNIKFCMEDENQRRTWEYLQGITRKDGSYGKILSDAFVEVFDGKNRVDTDEMAGRSIVKSERLEPDLRKLDELLDEMLEDKLQRVQENLTGQIEKCFRNCGLCSSASMAESLETDRESGAEQMHEPELSEDMMAFAFAMGE